MRKTGLLVISQFILFGLVLTACGSNETVQPKPENTTSVTIANTARNAITVVGTPTLANTPTNPAVSASTPTVISGVSTMRSTNPTLDDVLLYFSQKQVREIPVDPAFATQYAKVVGGQYKQMKYFVSDTELADFQPNFEKYMSSTGFVGGFSRISQSPYEGVASFYRAGNSSFVIGILTNMDGYVALLESDNTFSYQVMQDFIQNLRGKKMFLYILEP